MHTPTTLDAAAVAALLRAGIESGDELPLEFPMGGPGRRVLPIAETAYTVGPGQQVQITTGRMRDQFRPERFIIAEHPESWIVDDIKIGFQSQIRGSAEPIVGRIFSASASKPCGSLRWSSIGIQPWTDVSVVLTNVSDRHVCVVAGIVGISDRDARF